MEEGEKEEGEMEEGEMMTVRVGIQRRHHTHLCLSPPPDPRGDFDPPAGRPPAPTVVLEADLWERESGLLNTFLTLNCFCGLFSS